jgi:simple sugar transport system ATP-binding protein
MNLNPSTVRENATRLVEEYDVRTPSVDTLTGSLSGGNQQKVIVARELSREASLLIANQPTRGLDVGSIEYIHKRIIEKRDEGVAVLLVSSELDEILSLSDRIAVMYAGEILAILDAEEATKERLGLLMAGVREGEETSA